MGSTTGMCKFHMTVPPLHPGHLSYKSKGIEKGRSKVSHKYSVLDASSLKCHLPLVFQIRLASVSLLVHIFLLVATGQLVLQEI